MATPSRSNSSEAFKYGDSSRLTTKPGLSLTTIGDLPMRLQCATAVATVSSLVRRPRMTSINCMRRTGLKKCMPHSRSGPCRASANPVTGMVEVFEARIAFGGMCDSRAASS